MRAFMRSIRALVLASATLAAAAAASNDARACGGCIGPPAEVTQVTGHRMILSVALKQTTLWDQIT
jgi:hypothetical protein